MPGTDAHSEPATKRRPRIRPRIRPRLWIGVAIAVPIAIVAIPRAPVEVSPPAPTSAAPMDPGEALEEFWSGFEATSDDHSIAAFDRWVQEALSGAGAQESIVGGRATLAKEGDGRKLTLDGPGFSGRAELSVRPRRWPVADFALAAEDLSCVLCHVHIDGARGPARAFSSATPTDHHGKRVSITGGLVANSGALLFDDPAVDLQALRLASGTLEGPMGRVVAIGDEDPHQHSTRPDAPVSLRNSVRGHLELIGHRADPIEVRGNLIVEGDLLLRGVFVGDGVLFVDGNVFLPDGLEGLDGSTLTLVAMGSVLVGDVLRPRYDESLATTGDPEGSFGFLAESLARFNSTRAERPPLGWMPGQPAYRLVGSRATGDWYDPALERLTAPAQPAGPGLLANGMPWFNPRTLRESAGTVGGLTLDATVVTPSAFIAVASGLRTSPASPTDDPGRFEAGSVPPGAMLVRGSIAASHAAIHAPAGLRIIDAVVPRSMLGAAFGGGIEAVLESITAEGSDIQTLGKDAVIQAVSVLPEGHRARLRAPIETRADPGR